MGTFKATLISIAQAAVGSVDYLVTVRYDNETTGQTTTMTHPVNHETYSSVEDFKSYVACQVEKLNHANKVLSDAMQLVGQVIA